VIGEVRHQRIHCPECRRIDHEATIAARRNEAGIAQAIQMEREGVGWQPQTGRDVARRHSFGPSLDQKAEYVEAVVLRQSAENCDSVLLSHIRRQDTF
jgi:hypothetical protein